MSSEKPKLIESIEEVHSVDRYAMEDFILKNIGVSYFLWENENLHHELHSRHFVQPNTEDDKFYSSQWKKIKEEKFAQNFSLNVILRGLCTDGLISKGIYYIGGSR